MTRTHTTSDAVRAFALGFAAAATLPTRLTWMGARRLLDNAGRRGIANAAAAVADEELLRSALDADMAEMTIGRPPDRVVAAH